MVTDCTVLLVLQSVLLKRDMFSNLILRQFNQTAQKEFLDSIDKEELFYNVNIYDLLWGYNDPTMEILKKYNLAASSLYALKVRTIIPCCGTCVSYAFICLLAKSQYQLQPGLDYS